MVLYLYRKRGNPSIHVKPSFTPSCTPYYESFTGYSAQNTGGFLSAPSPVALSNGNRQNPKQFFDQSCFRDEHGTDGWDGRVILFPGAGDQ